jgi:hypothetical protein
MIQGCRNTINMAILNRIIYNKVQTVILCLKKDKTEEGKDVPLFGKFMN